MARKKNEGRHRRQLGRQTKLTKNFNNVLNINHLRAVIIIIGNLLLLLQDVTNGTTNIGRILNELQTHYIYIL